MPNVLTLTAHWSWPQDEAYGAAASMAQAPFSWLLWALPLTALSAPLLAARRRLAGMLVALLVPAAFVTKGLHGPLGGVNEWMYAHVPGFWLLREPQTKAVVVMLVLYGVLWALTVEGVAERIARRRRVEDEALAAAEAAAEARAIEAAAAAAGVSVADAIATVDLRTGGAARTAGDDDADRAAEDRAPFPDVRRWRRRVQRRRALGAAAAVLVVGAPFAASWPALTSAAHRRRPG